ncbi:MAG: MATE family efflux transporter, partial [Oscillospiraceae bacterium]
TVVAAYTAASKVQQLATQPAATFGFAMATYAGQNLGAGRLDRIKTGLKKTILISTIFNIALAAIVMIFGGFFTKLFVSGENTEVIALSKEYLLIVSPFYLVLGLLFIYRSALQGIGNAVIPLVSGAFELIMRVAVAFTLSLNFGYIGICFADPAAWIGATALLIISYYICMHNLVKRNNMRLEAAKLE